MGDLIVKYHGNGHAYHVGIQAGNNTTWATTQTGDVVRIGPSTLLVTSSDGCTDAVGTYVRLADPPDVVAAVKGFAAYDITCMRGSNHLSVACVNTDVVDAARAVVEYEVPDLR